MVVCLCAGTSERQIREAVRSGASHLGDVSRKTRGAGAGCGACCAAILDVIEAERRTLESPKLNVISAKAEIP